MTPSDPHSGTSIDSASAALFRAAPVPAYVYDLETLRFLEVNEAAVARYGWSRDEFLQMNLIDIRPPEEEARLREALAGAVPGLDPTNTWRHRTRSGEDRTVEVLSHTLEFQGRQARLAFVHDISLRLSHERSLEDTTDRLRAVLDSLPGVVFLVNEDGFYLEGSGEEGLLAVPVEQFVGKHLRGLFSPEQTQAFLDVIHRALDEGRILDYSYELDVPAGRVWFEARVAPMRVTLNGRRAVVWTAWNVTERHRATQALRESESRLRAMFDSEPECVKVIDRQGRIESMNAAGLRMLGVSCFEDLGDMMRFVTADDQPAFQKLVADALGGVSGELEFNAIHQDGARLHLHSTAVALHDASGEIASTMVITRDVTLTHELSRALEEQAELLRSIFDFIPIMIGVFDVGGRLAFPNRAFTETLGWSADQLGSLPDPLGRLLHDPTQRADAEAFFSTDASGWREYETSTSDQQTLRVAWTSVVLSDGRRILIGQDVTEQRSFEAQAWQSQKLESLGRLAGGVAHDFNNMLTVILGYVELIMLRNTGDDSMRNDIENVQQAAMRARDLTAQLLAFGRRQVTRRRLTSPEEVVRGITPLMRRVLGESITLETRSSAAGRLILADPAQLEQILMNLVLNARDAMPHGGLVTVETSRVEPGAGRPLPEGMNQSACIRLAVSDTGHGMDPATLDRVFEPFFSTKGLALGTGLGLATAYGSVKQNGGHIVASSTPGKGTTFGLYFPVAEGEIVEPVIESAGPVATRGNGEIVLLVEDDDTVREFLLRVLGQAGYRVLEVASVAEALRTAHSAESIDLILTDVVMTDGSGLDVVRGIEGLHPRAQKLLTSGYAESDAVRLYLRDPAVHFLQKPFPPGVLLRRVRELLDTAPA